LQDRKELKIETLEFTPKYSKEGSAGLDLQAYLPNNKKEALRLWPGERRVIPTGIKMEIPEGYMGLMTPRSGLAAKAGVTLTNSPGVIDFGYKDDVGVIIQNTSTDPFYIKHGDRIAQLLLLPVTYADVKVVESISMDNDRKGGFGSSGV
jgi:dUTP pyrophosphatase